MCILTRKRAYSSSAGTVSRRFFTREAEGGRNGREHACVATERERTGLKGLKVGSSLADVAKALGQPASTIDGKPIEFKDGVLHRNVQGQPGYKEPAHGFVRRVPWHRCPRWWEPGGPRRSRPGPRPAPRP